MDLKKLLEDQAFKIFTVKIDPEEFTFYDVLQMADYEIRQSNTIAWLFNNASEHQLKNLFLIKFIEYLFNYEGKNNQNKMILSPLIDFNKHGILIKKANEYINLETSQIQVKHEYKFIDILIYSTEKKFVITIENKPGIETQGQLSSYKANVIDVEFP